MVSTPTKRKRKSSRRKGEAFSTLGVEGNGHSDPAQLEAWLDHLRSRGGPKPLRALLGNSVNHPVLWERPDEVALDGDLLQQLQLFASSERRKKRPQTGGRLEATAQAWLKLASERRSDVSYATECLLWAYHLSDLAHELSVATWWDLHDHLLTTARESARVWTGASLLPVQLLAGELPLVLAYQFSELHHTRSLARKAVRFLAESMIELLDGQGMPHAREFPWMRPLFACWTRCLAIREALGKPKFPKDARVQYEWLIRQVLRTTRYDLRGSLQPPARHANASADAYRSMLSLAIGLYGDAADRAAFLLALRDAGQKNGKLSRRKLPDEPSYQSDWAELAVMRTGWTTIEPCLVVSHADKTLRVELTTGRTLLLAGDWLPELTFDGQSVALEEEWTATCWYADSDVDYLEIQTELSNSATWQRQFLLAREDYFALVMDAVLGSGPAKIDFRSIMPLADGVRFEPADETHEGMLHAAGKPRALVLPLGLPEWRGGKPNGGLVATPTGLELAHSVQAKRFCCAQFIDLHPRRLQQGCTWRQLTVAENLQIVPPEEAVGYRVQVGHEQWLFYRSLMPSPARSILGQHLLSEFLAARFLHDGDVEALVEVGEE